MMATQTSTGTNSQTRGVTPEQGKEIAGAFGQSKLEKLLKTKAPGKLPQGKFVPLKK